jgi:hypothetical protein
MTEKIDDIRENNLNLHYYARWKLERSSLK